MVQAEQVKPTIYWNTGTSVEICQTVIAQPVVEAISEWAAERQTREAHIARVSINEFVRRYSAWSDEPPFDRNAMALFYKSADSLWGEVFRNMRQKRRSDPEWAGIILPEDDSARNVTYWPGIPRFAPDGDGGYRLTVPNEAGEEVDYRLPGIDEDGINVVISAEGQWIREGRGVKGQLEWAEERTGVEAPVIASAALVRAIELRNAIRHGVTVGMAPQGLDWIIKDREVEYDKKYLFDGWGFEWPKATEE